MRLMLCLKAAQLQLSTLQAGCMAAVTLLAVFLSPLNKAFALRQIFSPSCTESVNVST